MAKVTFDLKDTSAGIPSTEMENLSFGVLTNSPWSPMNGARAGDPLFRIHEYLFFPKHREWNEVREDILVRPLHSGEKIVIEG